jgi:preprotein translocase subunit SecG
MDILIGILTVVEVIVCLLLILLVLMQRPRQEGLGASFGDAAMTQLVGAQTTNVLQRGTVYLAVTLFVLTLSLAVLTTRKQTAGQGSKVFDEPPSAVPVTPVAPAVTPAIGNAKSAPATPAKATEPAKVGDAAKVEAPKTPESKPTAAPAMKDPVEPKAVTPVVPAPAPVAAPAAAAPAVPATAAPAAAPKNP